MTTDSKHWPVIGVGVRGQYAAVVTRWDDDLFNSTPVHRRPGMDHLGVWLAHLEQAVREHVVTVLAGRRRSADPVHLAVPGPGKAGGIQSHYTFVASGYLLGKPGLVSVATAVLVPPYPHNPRCCPACVPGDLEGGLPASYCPRYVGYGRRPLETYPGALAIAGPATAFDAMRTAWDVAGKAAEILAEQPEAAHVG